MAKRKIPLSAEDPRYKEFLLRGARETFTVQCGTSSKAHQFQTKLHTYRSDMAEEHKDDPAMWVPLYGAMVTRPKEDRTILIIKPRREEFEDILSQIDNIEPETLKKDPLEDL